MRSAKDKRSIAILIAVFLWMVAGDLLAQGGGDVIPPASPPDAIQGRSGKPAARPPAPLPGP